MNDCIFCNKIDNIIYQTNNFYVKIGIGIVTAGHVMIISKKHFSCIADIDNNLINEYLDLKNKVYNKISNVFSKPFLTECGIFNQSVNHAHIHFIPTNSNKYKNINPIQDFVKDDIKYLNTKLIKIKNFYDLQEYFKKNKLYTYYEFNNNKYVVKVDNSMEEKGHQTGYRPFFSRIGLKGVDDWRLMTDEDKKNDKLKIEETKLKLKF